jgi:glycosyltransferase involved in cell wall biosynthesis
VGEKILLFLGGSNMHNVEAVTLFVDQVFQPLCAQHPGMRLLIGGSVCNELDASFATESIEILGEVDDLFQFYSLGDVVINPTVSGTGLKIKTFEAMAHGKVIIAHPHNTIGIYKKEEAPILEASGPEDYIRHINRIFEDKNAMIRLKNESVNYIRELNELVRSRFTEAIEV